MKTLLYVVCLSLLLTACGRMDHVVSGGATVGGQISVSIDLSGVQAELTQVCQDLQPTTTQECIDQGMYGLLTGLSKVMGGSNGGSK